MAAIDGRTTLTGLMGWPVAHSLSPAMHNAAAAALSLNFAYIPLPVHPDAVGWAVAGLAALGFRGANVTVPHKAAVIPYLNRLTPAPTAIGAVNTIVVDGSGPGAQLVGHNTDWSGFLADLDEQAVALAGRACVVLGAGGSARAVVYALMQRGARASVFARRHEQALALAADLRPHARRSAILETGAWTDLHLIGADFDRPLIINTTPVGMAGDGRSPWPDNQPLPPDSFVYDLVYHPAQTRLLQQAEVAACGWSNGLGMLLHQASQAFELWTGQTPDLAVMRAALTAHT